MAEQTLYRRNFLLHLQERHEYEAPVLLKEPAHDRLTGAQIGQLHNEYAISRQLDDVSGVRPAYTLEGSESHPVLLLKYIEGNNLAEVIHKQTLDLRQKLQLAMEITAILGRIHEAGVMHRDISSGHILVADKGVPGEPGGATIIDFGLAATLRHEDIAQPVMVGVAAGTLAYISPEQTGRMNRVVDYRSDLYSLGVTLYELFTGQLPFQTGDTMEMIHAHIAIQPIPPHEHNDEIPEMLSEIILKLMAKNAEDRYQSARGLSADLDKCLDQLQRTGSIETFELGQDDFSGRLQISQKLYGREAETKQLLDTYDRAAQGNRELLYIAGYSGVGKTALVHEMRREVLMRQGIFIEGKFDQLQRTLPYSAWAQAFTQLANNWLSESEVKLTHWRETILEAVGKNGQVLIDLIPALERIIGPQPEVPQLGGLENQNRFNYTFNLLISSLATPENPLVVFLDDLQWIDPASLSLIESLMAMQIGSSLLVIGAYRDNEVGADHPLIASQERMDREGDQVTFITLADLKPDDVDHLLADSLQLSVVDCRDLSQALREKTAGNPFYFRQQLYTLEAEELLSFDPHQRRWVWETGLQQSLQAGGNVVDLMVRKIRTLPVETQHTLSMAACLGNRFKIATLDTITGQSQKDILSYLNSALQSGLIVGSNGYFSFVHDRIQEAGYSLIPKSDLPITHLEIGRLLLIAAAEDLDEQIFTITGHMNAGRALIDSDSERIELAKLNLLAGQKAKKASAYADAKGYIEIGLELIGPDSWRDHYELTLSLQNENGELGALIGQFDQVSSSADLIHANAIRFLDRLRIYMAQIDAETMQYNFAKALELGLEALEDLGVDIPSKPVREDYQRLKDRLVAELDARSEERWSELPEMSDENARAASFLLASLMSATYVGNPALYPIIAYEGSILTLEYGLDAWSPFFLACASMQTLALVDFETPADVAQDYIFYAKMMQQIVLEMLRNPVTIRSKAKSLLMLVFVSAWTEPIEKAIELAQAAYLNGNLTGDALYSSFGAAQVAKQAFAAGMNLTDYQSQLSDYARSLSRRGQILVPQWLATNLQTAQNFRETLLHPDELHGNYLDEDVWLPAALASNDMSGRHNHAVCKLILAYHFDVDDRLDNYASEAEKLIGGGKGNVTLALLYLYFALSKLRIAGWNDRSVDPINLDVVNSYLRLLRIWSQSAPTTFQHKYDLILAEKARVLGEVKAAISKYEQAISGARESQFIHEEALANELYARFWADLNNDRFPSQFIREAHSLYLKWGALAKAEHLEKRYPNWLASRRITVDRSRTGTFIPRLSGDLDILTILKASEAIASEIELDRLLELLMTSAIENSGAQSGYLLLPEAEWWTIAAQADLKSSGSRVKQPVPIAEGGLLSQGIVNYVARTQQTVLLDDAVEHSDYFDDLHIQNHEVRSLLCTPLVNQSITSAILYLENNLAPGVFTPERVELLQLLSSQMAISIDNARTHDHLEQLLEERSRALDSAETQIRSLFANSPLGIALSTYSGQFLTVNKALSSMLCISEEDLLQQGAISFYADPADRDTILAELHESGAVQDFGVQLVRHDGSAFFASVNISQIVLEGTKVLLTIVEDITDQITAEQDAAARRERERLARELHDAVSQTLFSAGMVAEATPTLWEKDPATGRQNLEMLSTMIRGASAEMRSLLLELRPDTLRDQTLGRLLNTLAVTARARSQAEVSLNVEGDCQLAEDVTLAFHRIAQESLNNVAKHAEAGAIHIDLRCISKGVKLRIEDDGRGFDPQAIPAGHLGIGIMRERAQKIGATFEIDSKPGAGTTVMVSWVEEGRGMEQ